MVSIDRSPRRVTPLRKRAFGACQSCHARRARSILFHKSCKIKFTDSATFEAAEFSLVKRRFARCSLALRTRPVHHQQEHMLFWICISQHNWMFRTSYRTGGKLAEASGSYRSTFQTRFKLSAHGVSCLRTCEPCDACTTAETSKPEQVAIILEAVTAPNCTLRCYHAVSFCWITCTTS
jgi:hypothetical protein